MNTRIANQFRIACTTGAILALFASIGPAFAQVATQPAAPAIAETQPAMPPATALVAKVVGRATYTMLQPDGTRGPKQPVREGQRLGGGAVIETYFRSYVVLTFGADTVVKIDPLSQASIAQFLQADDTKNVTLDLGHGMIRAGSAAPTLRSEFSIVTTTATLSKRGTWEFGLRYEAGTGKYFAYLTDEGLIDVLNRTTGVRRTVQPTQYVTQAMIRWIETAVFNRWVPIQDAFGLTPSELVFNSRNNTGQGIAQAGGGIGSNVYFGRQGLQGVDAFTGQPLVPEIITPPGQQGPRVIGRPEGNFGARR